MNNVIGENLDSVLRRMHSRQNKAAVIIQLERASTAGKSNSIFFSHVPSYLNQSDGQMKDVVFFMMGVGIGVSLCQRDCCAFIKIQKCFTCSSNSFFLFVPVLLQVIRDPRNNFQPVGDVNCWDLYAQLDEDGETINYWAVHVGGEHAARMSVPRSANLTVLTKDISGKGGLGSYTVGSG